MFKTLRKAAVKICLVGTLLVPVACAQTDVIGAGNSAASVAKYPTTLAAEAALTAEERAAAAKRLHAVTAVSHSRNFNLYMAGETVWEGSNGQLFAFTRSQTGLVSVSFRFDPAGAGEAQMISFVSFVDHDGYFFASPQQRKKMRHPTSYLNLKVASAASDEQSRKMAAVSGIFGRMFQGVVAASIQADTQRDIARSRKGGPAAVVQVNTQTAVNTGVNLDGCADCGM